MNLKCKINIFIVLKPAVSEAKKLDYFLGGWLNILKSNGKIHFKTN